MEKKCFKCEKIKPIEEFYKHKMMGDGHLNKCKECTKNDVRSHYNTLSTDKDWLEKERERGRAKYHRLGYKDKYSIPEFRDKPIFKNIHRMLKDRNLINPDQEAHHWNYNLPYSVFILDKSFHRRLHKRMNLDKETLCYINESGGIMDKPIKHMKFMSEVALDYRFIDDIRKSF